MSRIGPTPVESYLRSVQIKKRVRIRPQVIVCNPLQWYVYTPTHQHPALTTHLACLLSGRVYRLCYSFTVLLMLCSRVLTSLLSLLMPWKQMSNHIPPGLTRISAGSCTNVWGVNAAGNVFRYLGQAVPCWLTSAQLRMARFGGSALTAKSIVIPGSLTTGPKFQVLSNESPLDRAPMFGESTRLATSIVTRAMTQNPGTQFLVPWPTFLRLRMARFGGSMLLEKPIAIRVIRETPITGSSDIPLS
jgi:hypothetical protein